MASSSSSITTTTVNGTTRITGLASGLDVDDIVKQLMTAEKAKKLNKLEQKEQTTEWTQVAYQDITSDIENFSDKYFDLTSSTGIMKASNFIKYEASSSNSTVSVTASSTASAGTHTVSVTQLATSATYSNGSSVSKDVQGSSLADYSDLAGESFVITLDGTDYTVDLDDVTDLDSLNTAISDALGSNKINVITNSRGCLQITSSDTGVQAISIRDFSSSSSALSELGFGTGAILSNRLNTSDTLENIAGQLSSSTALQFSNSGEIELTVNGTTMTFDKDDSLADMISDVNKADLGVTMKYDSVTGQLVMIANNTGAGNTLSVIDSGSSNFAAILLGKYTSGQDAKLTIDNQSFTRSSNNVTVDGVTYVLNKKTDDATVTVSQDTDGIYDLISDFVEDYNKLLNTINTALDQDKDSDYPPLTDDQKSDMTDEQISKWEAKAKIGLLENDSLLKSLVRDLRSSLSDSISGLTTTLASIGITTGTYDEKGTLYIDEDSLKSAIASDPESIMELFTQQATSKTSAGKSLAGTTVIRTLSSKDLSTRYKEEGIGYRIYDILQKNISTISDSAGNKGLLIEKAGITDSDIESTLSKLLDKYQDEIDDEKDRLDDYEDKLYDKYNNLETYINTMNTRLSALASLTGS